MTKKPSKPTRKTTTRPPARNPLAAPGGQELDPAVRAVIMAGAIRRGDKRKVTIWLPVEVYERIRALAINEGGSVKAFSDLSRVLLEHGLADYDAGNLKLKAEPVVLARKTFTKG
jgi:hypothetical protein